MDKVVDFGCSFAPEKDRDHCYQFGAVNTNNPELCEKIQGKDFEYSNPPKDKCYLLLANKTNDPRYCGKMNGGFYSYEPEECYQIVAQNTKNPNVCKELKGTEKTNCLKAFKLPYNYFEKVETKNETKNKSIREPLQEPNPEELNLKPASTDNLSDRTKLVLANLKEKQKNEIKSLAKESYKNLQKQNKVPEPPKSNNPEEEKSYLEKAWDWIGWGAQKAKDTLGDEAGKGVKAVATGKEIYDYGKDTLEAKEAIDKVNKKISENKISENRGNLLKVGYGLGKAVKWVASKVPIIGDTAGTVADESFKTSMKFGEKLAEHATKTDKCIEDPLADDCID
ncbi:MAG: hypothetical protein QXF76_00165 [Candidatus Anstonellales archaeon]